MKGSLNKRGIEKELWHSCATNISTAVYLHPLSTHLVSYKDT